MAGVQSLNPLNVYPVQVSSAAGASGGDEAGMAQDAEEQRVNRAELGHGLRGLQPQVPILIILATSPLHM